MYRTLQIEKMNALLIISCKVGKKVGWIQLCLVIVILQTILITNSAMSQVSVNQTSNIATNWIYHKMENFKAKWGDYIEPSLKDVDYLTDRQDTLAYVYQVYPSGYVVVAKYLEMTPVIAYSVDGPLNLDAPLGFAQVLRDDLKKRLTPIKELRAGFIQPNMVALETIENNKEKWEYFSISPSDFADRYLESPSDVLLDAGDILLEGFMWRQDDPFNFFCPLGEGGTCLVGCVATATSQIMKFHYWPLSGIGSHTYFWEGDGSIPGQELSADYSDSYDWNNMLYNYDGDYEDYERDAVAELSYEVGIAYEMDYHTYRQEDEVYGSIAYSSDCQKVLPRHFRYHGQISKKERADFTPENWFEMIVNELNENRPLLYRIGESTTPFNGHVIVCDGWDYDNMLHFNYGWGDETSSHWYAVDAVHSDYVDLPWEHDPYDDLAYKGIRPAECSIITTPEEAYLEITQPVLVEVWLSNLEFGPHYGDPIPGQIVYLTSDHDGIFDDNTIYTDENGYAWTQYLPLEAGTHIITSYNTDCYARLVVHPEPDDPYTITLLPSFDGCGGNYSQYRIETIIIDETTGDCAADGTFELKIQDCATAFFTETGSQNWSIDLNGQNCYEMQYWPHIRNENLACNAIIAARVAGYPWHYFPMNFNAGCPPTLDPILQFSSPRYTYEESEREVRFSDDGTKLAAVAMHNNGGYIYETQNWTPICAWNSNRPGEAVDFSPPGDRIVVVTDDDDANAIQIFDAETCARLDGCNFNNLEFWQVAWSNNQERIAAPVAYSPYNRIQIISPTCGYQNMIPTCTPSDDRIQGVDWSHGRIATVTHQKRVCVVNESGSPLWNYRASSSACVDFWGCEFSHDGTKLAVIGENRAGTCNLANLFIFNSSNGQILNGSGWWVGPNNKDIYSIAWSPDDSKLAVAGTEYAAILDVTTGAEILNLTHPQLSGYNFGVDWSANDFVAIRGNTLLCIYAPFDIAAPTITITDPPNNYTTWEPTVTISGSIHDDYSLVSTSYRINEGDQIPFAVDENWNFEFDVDLEPGTNEIEIRADDRSGNIGYATLTVIRLTDTEPPIIINSQAEPPEGYIGQEFSISSKIWDAEHGLILSLDSALCFIQIPDGNDIDTLQMYDDGNMEQHGDEVAGDSVHACKWESAGAEEGQYYVDIWAIDDSDNDITIDNAVDFSVLHRTLLYVSTSGDDVTGDGSEGNPFATIQHAIDVSINGDTVLVLPGTYLENINFNGRNIVVGSLFLMSENDSYISSTIIDGNSAASVVTFENSESNSAVITGFTIRNGFEMQGGGIRCQGSNPRIRNNTISGNESYFGGGGISCDNSNSLVSNNTICGNFSSDVGGGIYCGSSSNLEIISNTISENSALSRGGGISLYNSIATVTNTILWEDSAPNGPEIHVENGSLVITYSDIMGGWEGEGNADDDPLFEGGDPYDYHLQQGSPCIDTGDPNFPLDPDGSFIDMGALPYDHNTDVPAQAPSGPGDELVFEQDGEYIGTIIVNQVGELDSLRLIRYDTYAPWLDPDDPLVALPVYYGAFAYPDNVENYDLDVTYTYSQEDLDAAGIQNESELELVRSEIDPIFWEDYGGSVSIDQENNQITAHQVTNLSLWSIKGDPTVPAPCIYIPGDCNNDGTTIALDDVIAMIGMYRGSVVPPYECPCSPHGDNFTPTADPNGNCTANELSDVVTEIGAYRGDISASGCEDCPGQGRLIPSDGETLPVIPSLKSKIKINKEKISE